MRNVLFSLIFAVILSVVTTVAPVLAGGGNGSVPCCH